MPLYMYRKQNVEEKLRNEGVQPVKLRQRQPETTTPMWDTKSLPDVTRVYGEKPEYELEEPPFRYLANVEENFLHLRHAEAKKQFCERFLKAREIELRYTFLSLLLQISLQCMLFATESN